MVDGRPTWSGEKGRFWAEHADWFSRLLADFGTEVVAAAELRPGERVLDVGCGGGDLALAAAGAVAPDGSVLGVDLSPDELDVARVRAARRGVGNVTFTEADASRADLGTAAFDVLVSRFGVMFFEDPVAAFTHLHAALRPGGRLAFVCWQSLEDNDWMTVPRAALDAVLPLDPDQPPDSPGGFAFSDPDRVRSILTGAGFHAVDLADTPGTVHLGTSLDEALGFVQQMDYAWPVLDRAEPARADEARAAMRASLAAHTGPDGAVDLPGRTWIVRARS